MTLFGKSSIIAPMNRRQTLKTLSAAALGAPFASALGAEKFKIDYVLSSALYGDLPLVDVIPEVKKSGSVGLDIWGKGHATHREEGSECPAPMCLLDATIVDHRAKLVGINQLAASH